MADIQEYITRIQEGEILTAPDVLILQDDNDTSVALHMVKKYLKDGIIDRVKWGLMRDVLEVNSVMKVKDGYGDPLISFMSKVKIKEVNGDLTPYFPHNKDLLNLTDRDGTFMAMVFAELKHVYHFPEDVVYMCMRSKNWPLDNNGTTVAEQMFKNGYNFTEDELLQLTDEIAVNIGRLLLSREQWITNKELLSKVSLYGSTLAHTQARLGYQFDEFEYEDILLMKDHRNLEVAWISAEKGQTFTNANILSLMNNRGKSLAGKFSMEA